MEEILYRYRKYEIEYNRGLGIITINKKIPVEDFIELKKLLKKTGRDIKDIRVETEKARRWDIEKLL